MENKKKSRKVIRGSFTRVANELEVLLGVDTPNIDSVKVSWELLQLKRNELDVLDSEVYDLMLENATEAELETEIEARDMYHKKFTALRIRYEALFEDAASVNTGRSSRSSKLTNSSREEITGKRKFKLPTLQFKHYDGSVKDWLSFWAQFRKIHEDKSIDDQDKIEYLIQATAAGSRARQLVESYPAMSENYQKIIESMQSRFGREDLQIEVYVRGLLKLILTNSALQQKMDLAMLYDQIETQLRALDTLGITSDKCSAMLYPLIESCLPNDLLRVWQRSVFLNSGELDSGNDNSTCTLEVRLKKLMTFLKHEVENEQRIVMVEEGFGLLERKPHIRTGTKKHVDVPTATGLINHEVASCMFCAGSHESTLCFKAQKMTLDQKKGALSEKKACFRCLRKGHQSKKCKIKLRCIFCGRSHTTLMCPDIPAHKDPNKLFESGKDSTQEESVKDQALANSSRALIFLQTLRVTLKGLSGSKVVRALLDTGSQRSYILKETAVQLGYQPIRQEKVIHCLFGGKEMSNAHNCYDVTICHGKYSYKFEALDQHVICSDVAPISPGPWLKEVDNLGIEISDIRQGGPIELLLGADIVGNLYTGGHQKLPCGLIAMQTQVGWTLTGKIPVTSRRSDFVLTTLNLFAKDASISDFWELETLGIKEPSDRHTKEEMAKAAKDLFLQTVSTEPDGRYEVRLPWLADHPPLPTNYKLAQKRLNYTVRKLKNDYLFEQYNDIFREWESEGIVEQLGNLELTDADQGHYLPHRPVVKESSATTKIRPVYDASAHEKDKPSLNHCLEKGANLIELIPSLLLRFRENKIGVVSDVKKVFLQISVNERDRNYLRFLWVDSQGQEVIYRHRRVVFGLNSSPFLLGATLEYHMSQCLKNCSGEEVVYSQDTIERLSRSFYVDNCVTSLPDESSLTTFIKESVALMAEGQFELRGWECTQNHGAEADIDPCPVLGLMWCPYKDVLMINAKFLEDDLDTEKMVVTKRLILSITQKVFDPIGYLSPATLTPKLITGR